MFNWRNSLVLGAFFTLTGIAYLFLQGDGLYIDSNSIHMLFMRFPIDALFLSAPDKDGTRRVVSMRPNLPAWRGVVWYARGAKAVLELPAGTLDRHGVRFGDVVSIEVPDRAAASPADPPEPLAA